MFLDDIVAFSNRLKEEVGPGTKIDLVVREREVHAAYIMDTAIRLSERDTAKAILVWVSDSGVGN